MARPKRTRQDTNQTEIVEDLRALGFDVDIVCDLPGLYDLVVSGKRAGGLVPVSVRVEVKRPGQPLNENELYFWNKQQHPTSLILVEKTQDVLDWFGWWDKNAV